MEAQVALEGALEIQMALAALVVQEDQVGPLARLTRSPASSYQQKQATL
jgi:hypothetical protein